MPKHIFKSHEEDCRPVGCDNVEAGFDCVYDTLAVCRTCGAGEGELTTDCPGKMLSYEERDNCYLKGLDYTDVKGWFNNH